jgi:site-specific DNA-cytosine methylase
VFSYVEAFAGASAFSERAIPLGGSAIGFVEWEVSDHPLLSALEPSAWICGDLYDREWEQHSGPVDALLTWPMCKHLASCGLLRMQHDDVASQLWDTIDMAVHFEVRMVCTENVTRLEWDNQAHSLLDIDLQKWAAAGFSLAAVWFLRDCDLGGVTWRERVWIIKECSRLTSRLSPLYQPVMDAVPQHMRTLVLPVQEVEHLSVFGYTDVIPAGSLGQHLYKLAPLSL